MQTRIAGGLDRLRALLDSDFDPRVIFRAVRDHAGRICDFAFADVNEAACSYNGLPRDRLVGSRLLELFPNTASTGLFEMYCRTLETKEPLELRAFAYPHEIHGETRLYDIRAVPSGDELAYTWREVTGRFPATANNGNGRQDDGRQPAPGRPIALERRKTRQPPIRTEAQIREFQALAQALLEKNEEQQLLISRELHDNIAQVLSAATARIGLAKDEPIPAWLRQELLDLREQLREALADVRTLARELRPALLDHFGFAAALEKHAGGFRERTRMTLDVAVEAEAASFLDSGGLTHLFRLMQEALQNIEEHSGARRAWIKLTRRDGAMQLEIGDDGRAFTAERVLEAQRDGHLGLLGMRERAELLGGHFQLEAVPGKGTVIRVAVPPAPLQNSSNENHLSPHR